MKKIIKITLVFAVLFGFMSCDSKDDDTSFLDDRTSVSYFVPGSQASLFIEEGVPASLDINVGISERKPFARSFSFSIDPASTAELNDDYTTSSALNIPANSTVGTITINGIFEGATLEGKTVIINLDDVEDAVVGNRDQFTVTLIKSCPFDGLPTLDYNAGVFAFGASAPTFDITLVPVDGETNQWTLFTSWGTTFVSWATGDTQYDGQFLYSSTLVLNEDFSVEIIGNDAWASGGSGVYSPCNEDFQFTLTQTLFTNDFTVDVVLTPAP